MKSLLPFFVVASVFVACNASNVSVGGDADSGADAGVDDASVSDAGTCSLPKVVGPCEAAMPRFWFNAATGVCEPFTYGGCGGNANNFESAAACAKACIPSNGDASVGDGGQACKDTEIARLCVRGETAGGGTDERLVAGGKVKFQIFPKGCHSSSCTEVVEATCAVQGEAAGVVTLGGKFCLASKGLPACTPDCSGGGFAGCEASGLASGNYTAKLGALEVPFEIPGTLPLGGACAGSM